ncbi:unnamed protein product [Ambrosiozyma monospora]|uniref:Unnamed protein product n=1 Tax=Ambrosiozyma monospora TaxID=43982 RepID=A0ACB5SST7_AMBMO|nr:unnamed protein product [Ambrosiozyma monospora]
MSEVFYTWTKHELLAIDLVTFIFGFLSFISTIISLYWLYRMHPSEKSYRHRLYLYLMVTDCIRGITHIILPCFSFPSFANDNYNTIYFTETHYTGCDVSGFFTVTAFNSSDVVIAMIALHTVLIILYSSLKQSRLHVYKIDRHHWSWKQYFYPTEAELSDIERALIIQNNGYMYSKNHIYKQEAGLYQYDAFVLIVLVVILPVVLTSLAYTEGYQMENFLAYCFPVHSPHWVRAISTWGLRFVVILFVIVCYFGIYIYISYKFAQLTKAHERIVKSCRSNDVEMASNTTSGVKSTMRIIKKGIWNAIFNSEMKYEDSFLGSSTDTSHGTTGLGYRLEDDFSSSSSTEDGRDVMIVHKKITESPSGLSTYPGSDDHTQVVLPAPAVLHGVSSPNPTQSPSQNVLSAATERLSDELFQQTLDDFKLRKKQTLRSLKTIFVYPISYILLWVIPMVVQILRFTNDSVAPELTAATAAFQAADGVVQTIIFAFREKPWRSFKSRTKSDHFVELPDDCDSHGDDDSSSNHINMSFMKSLNMNHNHHHNNNNMDKQPQKDNNTIEINNMDPDYKYDKYNDQYHYKYTTNDYNNTDTQSTKPFAKQDTIPRSMNNLLPQIKVTTTNQTTGSASLSSDLLHIQSEIPKTPAELDVIRLVSGNSDYAMNSVSNSDNNNTINHADNGHGDGLSLRPPNVPMGMNSKLSLGQRSTDEVDLFQALSSSQYGHRGHN